VFAGLTPMRVVGSRVCSLNGVRFWSTAVVPSFYACGPRNSFCLSDGFCFVRLSVGLGAFRVLFFLA